MDAVDPHLVEQATAAAGTTVNGVHSADQLRIRWIGHTLRAEAPITVDPHLSLVAAHDVATAHARPAGAHL